MEARKPVSSSSSSSSSSTTTSATTVPSIVSQLPELFRRESSQFSSSGGIFDSVFPSGSNKAVRREVSISDTSLSWKKQQPEYKIWHTKQKSTDGNSQAAERDGRNISIKDGASGYTGELVEHTLLSSSVHYGGRDNFESSTTRTYAGTPTIFGNNSGEDVSDGGSPRGNWWQGSYYY
ncbi:uncharacterized protein [Aristolochia californica]|uniref:uncharacterized protein isoform X1 n=1 Tax=Aristolochia californica TaxID=171875 RepID=UPI0035E1A70D